MNDIYRWIIDQYRGALLATDPNNCRRIDVIMERIGHGWVSDQTIVDPDELLTAKQIEQKFGISQVALWHLIRRHQIQPVGKQGRSNTYRLGDVLAVRKKI